MTDTQWAAVDSYLAASLLQDDPALEAALTANAAAGLPSIDVSPLQGQLLHLLARMIGARRILEIGTLGGYSTIYLAKAVRPGGRVVTLEADPRHAGSRAPISPGRGLPKSSICASDWRSTFCRRSPANRLSI